jgi:hypothetical protein
MKVIQLTYRCLLADVARLTGFSEIRGSNDDLQWCLNEAPKLEKQVLRAIETGISLDLSAFPSQLRRLAGASVVDAQSLRYLRQLLLFCYKAYVPHDNDTTRKAYNAFIETNRKVGEFGASLSKASPVLLNFARKHCQSVLYRFRERAILPSHGPGASTTPKERWTAWYDTIEYCYPYSDWFSLYYNESHCAEWSDSCRRDFISAKLCAVPKDSRGPRLICVHPAESIWVQQGVRRELERAISLHRHCIGPWPRGHVRFDDQSVNGRIALLSSSSGKYATLDMKEASDRISEPLVQILFGDKYKWFGCCRAQHYLIPKSPSYEGHEDWIHSYAPMGNATTFPVQSLVFWAIVVASLQYRGFHQPGAAFVFGDDILVPSECAEAVIDDLESFGLLVNKEKSFWRGKFRESCGVDAFNGKDVTPVRWKCSPDAEGLTGLQSLSDIAMRLRMNGYEEAACLVYSVLNERVKFGCGRKLFKTNNPDHGGINEFVTRDSEAWHDAFWHRDSQQFVSPSLRLKIDPNSRVLPGWNQVLESVLSLERTGASAVPDRCVSRRMRLDRGWIPIL